MVFSYLSPNSLLWGSLLGKKRLAAICSGRVPGACPPRVRPVSALSTLSPLWPRLQTLSAMCPPCLGLCPPCVRPFSTLAVPPNLVCHVSALPFAHHVSAKALPLDFVRSWPAARQVHSIIRQNSFAPLRNPQRLSLYRMPAGQFPSYVHLAHQIRPSQAHPILKKLFGVYGGIIPSGNLTSINACFESIQLALLNLRLISVARTTRKSTAEHTAKSQIIIESDLLLVGHGL